MVATNLYGSIVTNVVCGIVGGAGLLSGRNYGDHYAVFEPGTRNTGTAIAGKNKANPIAMLNASVDLLNHLNLKPYANMISDAIYKTTVDDQIRTMGKGGRKGEGEDFVNNFIVECLSDLGGTNTSREVVDNILRHLEAEHVHWYAK